MVLRRQLGQGLREMALKLIKPVDGLAVRVSRLAARHVGCNHQPNLFADVVEGQHFIEEEHASVGDAQLVLGQIGQSLDLPNCVI